MLAEVDSAIPAKGCKEEQSKAYKFVEGNGLVFAERRKQEHEDRKKHEERLRVARGE